METHDKYISSLLERIAELEERLTEASALADAVREGSVDAFVLRKDGRSDIYALESIDYTYRILIEKFGEGALSVSEEGLILYCNACFSDLLGVPGARLMGSYLHEHVENPEAMRSLFEELKAGISKGELLLMGAGRRIPVYMSLTSLQPYLPAIGIIVTDQTQKKRHEEEIIRYQRQLETKIKELNTINTDLEQFVHIISHDIKEPLRKIVSYGERLRKELSGALHEKNVKTLNIINDATMRLNLLVDDLVQYSFASNNQRGFKEVDLNTVFAEVRDDIEIMIKDSGAVVNSETLPTIMGSEIQMRQLFSNLLINAIKYSKKGIVPRVTVSSPGPPAYNAESGQVCHKIIIADNGIGIEEQYLQKIFTIFQRLHAQSEYSGTGIGLAICKKIVENHKGSIDVESMFDKGSKFFLYLPVITPS